jgi:F-type H+-transporting ATPase subunit delta
MIEAAQPEPAERAYDARGEQIAAVYAKAFVGAGQAAGQLAEWVVELDHLIDEILNRHPRFEELLASALVAQKDKLGILDRVLGGRLSTPLVDFCKVLSEHSRLDLLRSIHQQIHTQYDALRGLKPVRVSTAAPLDAAAIEKLKPTLRTLSGGEPVIEYVVDPALIGGIVLRIGDTVYDGSVARRLEQVREKMIERTVHEIQSRRDSFRYPDGN